MQAERMQVESAVADGVPARLGAGGHAAGHLVRAAHERVGAHLVTLLDSRNAPEGRILADAHVAANLAAVRDDGAFADVAVVGDMRIRHDKNLVRNPGAAAALDGAAVDSHVFAKGAAFADAYAGRFARIF